MTRKLNCFIACAFDKKDVDQLYEKTISPLQEELEIILHRVDKKNHNNKIDQEIIKLIKECDFGIADLTYARPSVYYEAGFINGMAKKVIFTACKNHFIPDSTDINGNRKIHFDLSTENIIQWEQKSLNVFKSRLKARIRLITREIIKKNKDQYKMESLENEFSNRALNDRLECISNLSKKIMQKHKFKITTDYVIYKIGYKTEDGKTKMIASLTKNNFTKKELRFYSNRVYCEKPEGIKGWEIGNSTIIFNSINAINEKTLQQTFCDCTKNPSLKEFTFFEKEGLDLDPKFQTYKESVKEAILLRPESRIIVIDNIKSETDYKEKISQYKKL